MTKNFLLKIEESLQKKWFVVFVLLSLLFFQLIYSLLLFPACSLNDNSLPISSYLPKFTAESSDNLLLEKIYPLISPEYRLNSDVGGHVEAAHNFSSEYLEGSFAISRPLYPFLVFLFSLPLRFFGINSLGVTFVLAILVNFILLSAAVLLFFSLLKKLFSLKLAWLSSILLIFSPYVHNSLIQPLAEMLMAFAVALTVYLLYNYIQKPSTLKLIVFSLIIGVLMLGKMFFAITFFILLLAIYFKRYKEGLIFLIFQFIPFGLWYLWVTKVWRVSFLFYDFYYYWTRETGIFDVLRLSFLEIGKIFLHAIPYFITSIGYGFLFIPIIFSLLGWRRLPFRAKKIIYFGSISSVFLMGFMLNHYVYRHAFLLFPIIYPTAVLGIGRAADFLKRFNGKYSLLFYITAIGFMIFISSINFHFVFNFDYLQIVHWHVWPLPEFLENFFREYF